MSDLRAGFHGTARQTIAESNSGGSSSRSASEDESLEDLPEDEVAADPLQGTTLSKKVYGHVWFAYVTNVQRELKTQNKLYQIEYSDGDLEHLTKDEVLEHEVVVVPKASSLQADFAKLWEARRIFQDRQGSQCEEPNIAGAGFPFPADFVLVCEDVRFEVDKMVLAARSAYFSAMFANQQFREAAQQEVELKDFSAESLEAALRYMYTDKAPMHPTREAAEELLVAASKLEVPGLLRICSDLLRDNYLNHSTAVSLLRLADAHSATSLRTEALATIAANFKRVKRTQEWEELLKTGMNPMLMQDMLQAVYTARRSARRSRKGS